eukprot:13623985-Heterocapsa_arctica.AAC.1
MASMESAQKRIFKAMVSQDMDCYDMHNCARMGWTPWKTLLEWLRQPKVWGPSITEKDFWSIIMMTKNRDMRYHSYMVKKWPDKRLTVIKLSPK